MEMIPQAPPIQQQKRQENAGCLAEAGFLVSAAVLPMGSLNFYRKAAQKSVMSAMVFFFAFTAVITCALTVSVTVALYSVSTEIKGAYERGDIPEIAISGGVAEVDAPQPLVLLDEKDDQGNSVYVAIDTTGKLSMINEDQYRQGILLTRTDLHILNEGDYQVVPLKELNTAFEKDPLLINADTVTQAWNTVSGIMAILVLLGLWLWHFILRLMIIAVYALVMWGIVSLVRPGTGFGPVIITGLYALAPAVYVSHLFSRADFTFPGLQSFFLFIFWTIGLIASLMDHPLFKAERPLRGWTALIGAPMLILFMVDMIRAIPAPYGVPILWAVFVLTFAAHAGVRAFFRYQDGQTPPDSVMPTL